MSGLLNPSFSGSSSNLPDASARPFTGSFSVQSATAPGFHPSGGLQGLHNIHGSFNLPNMLGSLSSRTAPMSGVPSSGVQQPGGSISNGRYSIASNQMSHGSGAINRGSLNVLGNAALGSSISGIGGSLNGLPSNSVNAGNRSSIGGLGVSQMLGNAGPRITNSIGNSLGGDNMGRSINSGGLNVSSLSSRVNMTANNGSSGLIVQGPNRLMTGMLQQAPQMIGMLGNSYTTRGGPLTHCQVQGVNGALNTLGMLNDVTSNENSPFDINDFPQLSSQPSSSGGPQNQLSSMRKQGVGVSSIVQPNQEFSIQNEEFPALPGYKGGNSEFSIDMNQTEQLCENVPMMQSQHFPMNRTAGFNLGGSYPLQHTVVSSSGHGFAPGCNQDLSLHGSDLFPSSHGNHHSQVHNSGTPSIGLRPVSTSNPASGMEAYEQLIQQYQNPNQPQFRSQHMSAFTQPHRDENLKSIQGTQSAPDRFGMLGLLSIIKMTDPGLSSLALGIDLTTLGLNLNSSENLYKTFGSPWSDKPAKGEPEYSVPKCYVARPTPPVHGDHYSKFHLLTLFYIFYSMPKDVMQLYAAYELCSRGWFYHKDYQLWFTRIPKVEPLVKTAIYERGSYLCFDPNIWDAVAKENLIMRYDSMEKPPTLP